MRARRPHLATESSRKMTSSGRSQTCLPPFVAAIVLGTTLIFATCIRDAIHMYQHMSEYIAKKLLRPVAIRAPAKDP